ncbi:hypothetical protein FALBO_3420 [Fusarium albosuccineum]|uniref:Uncharacterized protein n=1 Tax=Fusarium albosuccineum TaxID=1237068 RepID=A0A8H4PL62_9HYPO|nr:hypothetical protein FALBO_3420 [Fusarium albosuccineum]
MPSTHDFDAETQLSCTLTTKGNLQLHKKEVNAKLVPGIPWGLWSYWSPLWVVIRNLTQFDIAYVDSLFQSGEFWGDAPSANPWDVSTFGLRNSTTFVGIGYRPSGAINFSVLLDESYQYEFSMVSKCQGISMPKENLEANDSCAQGFGNPMVGSYKASLIEGGNMQEATKLRSKSGGKITSDKYVGVDAGGQQSKFQLYVTVIPGKTITVTISQNPL